MKDNLCDDCGIGVEDIKHQVRSRGKMYCVECAKNRIEELRDGVELAFMCGATYKERGNR